MTKHKYRIALIAAMLAVGPTCALAQQPAEPGWFCGSRDGLLDYQIDRVNNFSIAERKSFLGGGLPEVELTFSVTNKKEKSVPLSAQLVGLSSAGNIVLGLKAAPMMHMVSGNKTEGATGSVYVPSGDLAKSQTFCLQVVGAF